MSIKVREFQAEDADALAKMVHAAVHEGAASAYDETQRAAWSPAPRSAEAMRERIRGQFVLLAEDEAGLAGVFTLTDEGCIDLAFVRPDQMGQGTATRLHTEILKAAGRKGLSQLTVEASHLARRFFSKHGWQVIETQTVYAQGVALENHKMVLQLEP